MKFNFPDTITVKRLTTANTAEVTQFLNRTWPTLYGETGCPVFNDAYLNWLYGGPNQDRNLILGCFKDDILVAMKALLFRPITDGDRRWSAHVGTHLTVSPDLEIKDRATLTSTLAMPLTVGPDSEYRFGVTGDISIAYFEDGKTMVRIIRKVAQRLSLHTEVFEFRQAIVVPSIVRQVARTAQGMIVRRLEQTDIPDILSLIKNVNSPVVTDYDAPALWHHVSNAPGARAWVVEHAGTLVGALSAHRIDWMKAGQVTPNIVVEFVLGNNPEAIAVLLSEVLDYAKIQNTRGLVVENSTYLDQDLARVVGIFPTPRKMMITMRSPEAPPTLQSGFCIDIK